MAQFIVVFMLDVKKEAKVLASLCHPLPLCNLYHFKTITNCDAVSTDCKDLNPQSITLAHELQHPQLQLFPDDWLITCAQLLDAVDCLHATVNILHNDNNLVLGKSVIPANGKYHRYSMVPQAN